MQTLLPCSFVCSNKNESTFHTFISSANTELVCSLSCEYFLPLVQNDVQYSVKCKACLAYIRCSEFAGINMRQTTFIHLMNLRLSHTFAVPIWLKTQILLKANLPNECSYHDTYSCFCASLQPSFPTIFFLFLLCIDLHKLENTYDSILK